MRPSSRIQSTPQENLGKCIHNCHWQTHKLNMTGLFASFRSEQEPRKMLDQYEIIKSLGEGGSGTVLQARQRLADRIVAIKVLSAAVVFDDTSLKRFQREARIAASLDHPNIARIYSFGVSPEKGPYLVMEYLEGRTLAELLKESKLSVEAFENIFSQVCSALEYAHAKSIIHRDIKPANIILVRSDDGTEQVKVLDFGIAKKIEDQSITAGLTQTGVAVGTPLYMSPEQCSGASCDQRSDIYSLGCVMYEALCGSPPFTGDTAGAVMLKQLNEQAPGFAKVDPKLKLPPSLISLVYCCLNKQPESRPQSVAEVASRILEAAAGISVSVSPKHKLFSRAAAKITLSLFVVLLGVMAYKAITVPRKAVMSKKAAAQQKTIQLTWSRINELVEKADAEMAEQHYSDARQTYMEVLQVVQRLSPSEKEKHHADEVLYSVYSGLSKIAPTLGLSEEEILDCMYQSMRYASRSYGSRSEQMASAERYLALKLANSRRFLEAETVATDLLKINETNFKDLSTQLAGDQLAMMARSEQLFITEGRLGDAKALLGYIKMMQDKNKEGLELLKQAYEIERTSNKENDTNTLWTMSRLCMCLDKCNQPDQANELLHELLQRLAQETSGRAPAERQGMLYELSNYYKNRKDYKRNKTVLEALVTMNANDYGPAAPETVRAKEFLKNFKGNKNFKEFPTSVQGKKIVPGNMSVGTVGPDEAVSIPRTGQK